MVKLRIGDRGSGTKNTCKLIAEHYYSLVDITSVRKAIILLLLALIARILFLEWVGTDYTGWYVDSYHHWQIAIYTLNIGLAQNPPRMWDLNGLEYFWGLLPTLTESFLLYVFNTTSLAPFRIFNSIMGSFSVVLIYLLGRRYFNEQVGLIAGVSSAISPVLWEVDTSGMLDPMGITFLFLGLLLYRKKQFLSGVVLGLASLAHVEFWFLSLAIISFYAIYERSATKVVPALAGWLVPMAPYFYFMETGTGDWLYSLRMNYFSSISGQWIKSSVPVADQILPRSVFLVILASCIVAVLYLLKRKPISYPFHSFFLARISMQGIVFGLTPYVLPYIAFNQIPRVLIDRLFAFDYYYVPVLIVIMIGWLAMRKPAKPDGLPEKRELRRIFLSALVLVLILNTVLFPFVVNQYSQNYPGYLVEVQMANFIDSHYRGGIVISSDVLLNYRLINGRLKIVDLLGSVYCPSAGGPAAYNWLKSHNVTWVILDDNLKLCFPALLKTDTTPFHVAWGSTVFTVDQAELLRISGT